MAPRPFSTTHSLWLIPFLGFMLSLMSAETAFSSTGTEVFRGFTKHISEQIVRDKQNFYVAQTCTTFFYKKTTKPPVPQVEKIAFALTKDSSGSVDCSTRYPKGLNEAREAFAQTQQALSLSLTFFQFALVGDRDDDEQYGGGELRDVMESFGVRFEDHLPSTRYVSSLNQLFDAVMNKGEIETLTHSMGILLRKGYRFTQADQVALNREIN